MDEPLPIPDVVPAELSGKWIAWDENALHIVASGDTEQQAIDRAKQLGVDEPYLEKVPQAARFIGRL